MNEQDMLKMLQEIYQIAQAQYEQRADENYQGWMKVSGLICKLEVQIEQSIEDRLNNTFANEKEKVA